MRHPAFAWLIASTLRRIRTRLPTCWSMGFGASFAVVSEPPMADRVKHCQMRRWDGLVGFWRVPSRAYRLVSSDTCRICSHAA